MRHTRIRCTAVMCSVMFLVLLFFTLSTSTASAAINDHIISGKTPQGTVISLFDYWVNQQDSPDHGNSNNNSDGGINKDHDLKFSNGNGYSGFNNWTGSSAPYSGMVMNTLNSNGYPFLATDLMNLQGQLSISMKPTAKKKTAISNIQQKAAACAQVLPM